MSVSVLRIIISEKETVSLVNVCFKVQPDSINSASRLLPNGVYTTLRTYESGKVLPLDDHIKRLEVSAALIGYQITLNPIMFYKGLQNAIRSFLPHDTRIRFTVDLQNNPGDVYLSIEPLKSPSPDEYRRGVLTITNPMHRENPESKQTSFIEVAEKIRQTMAPAVHECLLLDASGHILEGLSSNFFYVREGVIFTAPQGILSGITRSLLMQAMARENIPINFKAAHKTQLPLIKEAFITSSTRCVLPVRQIDDVVIGEPGPLTLRVQAAYWNLIKGLLVEL